MRPYCSRYASNERAHRILAVPGDARAIEAAEHRLEAGAELDQLDVSRQLPCRVHIGDAATARHSGKKHNVVSCAFVALEIAVEVRRGSAPMMEAVAATFDPFA